MSEMKLEFDDELGVFLLNGSAHIDGLDASQDVLRELHGSRARVAGYRSMLELMTEPPAKAIESAIGRVVCARCGVDRLQQGCPDPRGVCVFYGGVQKGLPSA